MSDQERHLQVVDDNYHPHSTTSAGKPKRRFERPTSLGSYAQNRDERIRAKATAARARMDERARLHAATNRVESDG